MTANQIIETLEEQSGGWERQIPLKVGYDPDQDKPYTVSVGNVYTQRGYSLKGAMVEAAESASKQKLIDELKRRSGD